MFYCNRLFSSTKRPLFVRIDGAKIDIKRIPCNQWDCPVCSAKLRRRWRSHLQKELSALHGYQWSFVTITAPSKKHKKGEKTVETYRAVASAWRVLTNRYFRRMYKANGDNQPVYVRVLELHKSGAVHLHAIVGTDSFRALPRESNARKSALMSELVDSAEYARLGSLMPNLPYATARWKDFLSHIGAGYQHDVRSIGDTAHAVNYVCKYVTKFDDGARLPKGVRRIATSQSINALPRHKSKDWGYQDGVYLTDMLHSGLNEIVDSEGSRRVGIEYFENKSVYPDDLT